MDVLNFKKDLSDQARGQIGRVLDIGHQKALIEIRVDFAYGCEANKVVVEMVQRDDEPEDTIMALLVNILASKLVLVPSVIQQQFTNLDPAALVCS